MDGCPLLDGGRLSLDARRDIEVSKLIGTHEVIGVDSKDNLDTLVFFGDANEALEHLDSLVPILFGLGGEMT